MSKSTEINTMVENKKEETQTLLSNGGETETKVSLSTEERLLLLEKNVKYLTDLIKQNNEAYNELIEALNKMMEKSTKHDKELELWIETVEQRIGRVMVENVNLSLVVGEAITLTPEQQKNINRKIAEIKSIHKQKSTEKSKTVIGKNKK